MTQHHLKQFVLLFTGVMMFATACASVDAPRRSTRIASSSATAFDSPRVEYTVEESPDIGSVAFRGVVRGRSPRDQFAPADGFVFDVRFERNTLVQAGDVVLTFLPARTDAEAIELEIARLDIELAVARAADGDTISAAQLGFDELEAAFDARATPIKAEITGVIGSTRQNIRYPVTGGDPFFTLSDATDLVVEVDMTVGDWRSLPPSAEVTMVRSVGSTEQRFTGTLQPLAAAAITADASDDQEIVAAIAFDQVSDLMLGDRVAVSISIETAADARWIPQELVHRRQGQSFLISSGADGLLSRIDIQLGRRTLTHVQVLSPLSVGTTLISPA